MLGDLVAACDAQIDSTFAYKRRDIRGGQENQSDGQVLDQCNVETGLAPELYVTTGKQVQRGLLQTTLCAC